LALNGCAVTTDGAIASVPLKDLYICGLPTIARPIRRRIDTDFADWREIPATEYVEALGISVPNGLKINHQFFEVAQGARRFVVPALALMRGLFRPSKHLLPAMFVPQALDQMCQLKKVDDSLSLELDAKWAMKSILDRASYLNSLASWMYAYPSAFSMTGSIHQNATCGNLGLSLPNAQVRIVLRGHEVGQTLFVTDASIVTITPSDEPVVQIAGMESVLSLHDRVVAEGGRVPERARQYAVPLRADGSTELSDEEWSEVEPILDGSRQKGPRLQLSQRELLDGVLTKLATGTPWKRVRYSVGNWQNASQMFQQMAERNVLGPILEILTKFRTAPQ
jgi:hypothetical protein